jgi:hypothetical protein
VNRKLYLLKTVFREKLRVGKKAGTTNISQDGRKYWEIRLIFNLQI